MKLILIFLALIFSNFVYSQKPVIDTNSFDACKNENKPDISHDGKYVSIFHKGAKGTQSLIIQSTKEQWRKEFSVSANGDFSDDSKFIIFKKNNDTLCVLRLGADTYTDIPNVESYKLSKLGAESWLAYRYKSIASELVLENLVTLKEVRFDSVKDYIFITGESLLVQTENGNDSSRRLFLKWIDLKDVSINTIWKSFGNSNRLQKILSYSYNKGVGKLAFLMESKINSYKSLWLYSRGMDSAIEIINDQDRRIRKVDSDLVIGNFLPGSSSDGSCFLLKLEKIPIDKPGKNDDPLEVWSSSDLKLKTQTSNIFSTTGYFAAIDIMDGKLVMLSGENEIVTFPDENDKIDFVLIQKCNGDIYEANWNFAARSSSYVVSCKDGSRKLIRDQIESETEFLGLSPGNKWAVYYDLRQRNYFSYEMATGVKRNITKSIPVTWENEEDDNPVPTLTWGSGSSTWTKNDGSVLIYDNYDIWLVDPSCVKPPINVTNGYGYQHKIKFIVANEEILRDLSIENGVLLLSAFNKINKENGFYLTHIYSAGNPKMLTMGPYIYCWETNESSSFKPLKAKYANVYLVQRMSVTDAPNFFVTTDFVKYAPVTNFEPQKSYNWMTSHLIRWKTFNGSYSDGILYKPENFDSSKKYPIIFYFYERLSKGLNEYLYPEACIGPINIPWFVSRGYLVFAPDIYYTVEEPGESAYNSVVSAANYLAKMPWVDSTKMAIQGHSWGGYQVNYLITRTNIFAAAADAAGPSNFISGYGLLSHHGRSRTWLFELNQSRIGATLWQRPDLYIKNSPVLKADKVTTPLLIMHNKNDGQVPWSEGLQWFMALRRLGKKAWMLQYNKGGHVVDDEDAIDYTLRLTHFFDHYLKGTPMSEWMN